MAEPGLEPRSGGGPLPVSAIVIKSRVLSAFFLISLSPLGPTVQQRDTAITKHQRDCGSFLLRNQVGHFISVLGPGQPLSVPFFQS